MNTNFKSDPVGIRFEEELYAYRYIMKAAIYLIVPLMVILLYYSIIHRNYLNMAVQLTILTLDVALLVIDKTRMPASKKVRINGIIFKTQIVSIGLFLLYAICIAGNWEQTPWTFAYCYITLVMIKFRIGAIIVGVIYATLFISYHFTSHPELLATDEFMFRFFPSLLICVVFIIFAEYVRNDYRRKLEESNLTLGKSKEKYQRLYEQLTDEVAERKQAEEALRKSEDRYRLIAENVGDVIWTLDMGLNVTYISPSVYQLRGFTPEEVMEQSLAEALLPDSFELAMEIMAEKLTLIDAGDEAGFQPVDFELRQPRKDGSVIWTGNNARILPDPDNKPASILGITRDITMRKKAEETLRESEERYRLLLQNSNDAIYVHEVSGNGPGRFVEVNDRACRLLGYTRDEFLSMNINDIDVPENRERFPDILNRLYSTGHAVFETEALTKDGKRVPLEVSARLFKLKGAATVLAAARDISKRIQAEEEREHLQAQLNQSRKMESVGRLAGGVAHDFNNMLGVILGHTEMALMEVESGHPTHFALKEIQKAAQRSADLTGQLLAYARRQPATPKVLDLNDTISGMLKMLRRLIGEDIELVWMPGANLWPVKIDPAQVDQILANLCVNARDAIQGAGRITIETRNIMVDKVYSTKHPHVSPGRYTIITVGDNGTGMNSETLENLFEPFFTTKEVGKGTGLGLATVYGLVKQNNGFIDVYSEPGQGSVFKIHLPMTQEKIMAVGVSQPKPIPRGTETVLVVEDEDSVLKLTRTALKRLGYKVLAARAPSEALEIAEQEKDQIHLLLTDVVMPKMNGKELMESIQRFKPDLKVLFMSGYTADVIMLQGILEQDVHFLQKPFSVKSLAEMVRKVLDEEIGETGGSQ